MSTYVLKSSLKPQEIEEALLKVTDLTSPVPSSNTDFVEPKYFRGQVGEGSFYIQQQQTGDFSTPILRGTYAESDKGSTIYLVDEYPDIARYLMGTLVGIYLIILLLIPKDYNFLPKAIGFALLIGLVVYFIRLGYISVRKQNIAKFKEAVKVSAY
ncbi:MAG: hypothetical protein HWE14_05180 [Flavobacteriia bacterium]|nr:hypothetical protein [Flavobacteriia bacterium]